MEIRYLEWIKKGDEDLASLRALLKHKEGSPSTACFLSQQATEKFLKALLIFKGQELEKVHDLVKILNSINNINPELKNLTEKIAILNRYYVETRYPGDFPEFTWAECEDALKTVEEIKSFIMKELHLSHV